MTEGPGMAAYGSNYHPMSAATIQISTKTDHKEVEEPVAEENQEVQIISDKKARKDFKKPPD